MYYFLPSSGLGVDDAFVIMQAWNRLSASERKLPLEQQAGHALKHAGVSITVTSITDIVAFGIGATTVNRQESLTCEDLIDLIFYSYVYLILAMTKIAILSE